MIPLIGWVSSLLLWEVAVHCSVVIEDEDKRHLTIFAHQSEEYGGRGELLVTLEHSWTRVASTTYMNIFQRPPTLTKHGADIRFSEHGGSLSSVQWYAGEAFFSLSSLSCLILCSPSPAFRLILLSSCPSCPACPLVLHVPVTLPQSPHVPHTST